MATTVRHEVDGTSVIATCFEMGGFPRVFEVRRRDGLVLGYVRKGVAWNTEVYLGSAEPDAVGSQLIGTCRGVRAGLEHLVRAAKC